jgi:hypothetical protein
MSLRHLESYFTVLRLAYLRQRDAFLRLQNEVSDSIAPHLANFLLMMEFCVPVVQDYGLAIRHGTFKEAHSLYGLVLICMAIFQDSYYVENMGLFLLILEYQKEHQLPLEHILDQNWANMNGEDIELANRSLSKATKSTSGQSNVEFLHRSARLIGAMREAKSDLVVQLEGFRSLKGFRGKKRMQYKVGDDDVSRAERYLRKVIREMRRGDWTHYKINYGSLGKRKKGD